MTSNLCIPPEELDGFGAILRYYDTQASQWVIVGGTKDLALPDDTSAALDTTTPDLSGSHTSSMPASLATLSAVDYEMNFRRAQWTTIKNIKAGRHTVCWQIVLTQTPEQWYYQFCGWIHNLGAALPMGALVTASLGITPTGGPTTGQLANE